MAYDGSEADELDALAAQAAAGDQDALNRLLALIEPRVMRICARMLPCRQDAEEACQDALLRVATKIDTFRGGSKFTTWLYTLAHNRLIDHFRRHKGPQLVSLDGDDEGDPLEVAAQVTVQPERRAEAREQAARHLGLVEALPAVQREAFLLHEEGGLSLEQIAEVTGAGRETVKSRLRYALDKLREGMRDYL